MRVNLTERVPEKRVVVKGALGADRELRQIYLVHWEVGVVSFPVEAGKKESNCLRVLLSVPSSAIGGQVIIIFGWILPARCRVSRLLLLQSAYCLTKILIVIRLVEQSGIVQTEEIVSKKSGWK